jgi:hypothetical protein
MSNRRRSHFAGLASRTRSRRFAPPRQTRTTWSLEMGTIFEEPPSRLSPRLNSWPCFVLRTDSGVLEVIEDRDTDTYRTAYRC